jgi:hypothetical protein
VNDRPLPSWNDGATRDAILAYVERVSMEVPERGRIAVFDNDGTLWCEKPTYLQAYFLLERLHEQVAADPALGDDPIVQALLAGDLEAAASHGLEQLTRVLLGTHAGWTAEEFSAAAAAWLSRPTTSSAQPSSSHSSGATARSCSSGVPSRSAR